MKPRIDTLYIYKQKTGSAFFARFDSINQRLHEEDFRFLRGNVPDKADNVYRYALTVTINDMSRTFLMVTLDSSVKKVARFFIEAAKQIEEDPKLLKTFMTARRVPAETPITYGN